MSDINSAYGSILDSAAPSAAVDLSKVARPQTFEEYTAHQANLAEAKEFAALPSADVKTGKEAQAALDARVNSKVFYNRFMRGEMQATRDWKTLHEVLDADPGNPKLDAILDGSAKIPIMEITSGFGLQTRNLMEVVQGLKDKGLSDDTIRQAVNGVTITKAEHDGIELMRKQLTGDAEWGKKLLAGDFEANRQMTLMNIILNCDVEGETSKAKF
jgi:hypothetical protein